MSRLTISLLIWGMLVLHASARHGETPSQCEARYGAAVTNLPGNADIEQVAIYRKDDLNITAIFIKGYDNKVTVEMIFYTRAQPFAPSLSLAPNMSAEDEATILGTVKGQWETDKPTQQLAGPKHFGGSSTITGQRTIGTKPNTKAMTSGPGVYATTSEKVAKAVQNVLQLVYPKEVSYTAAPISHNGLHLYAFRTIHGIAICSDQNISRMTKWAEYIRGQNAKPIPKSLDGL